MQRDRKVTRWIAAWTWACLWFAAPTVASAQITAPGNHVHYAVELEPHLLLQWARQEGYDQGIGFGARVSVPIIDNGPIPNINNTLAFTTGLDLGFFTADCVDCSAWQIWAPVAAQWNFYFSPELAAFGELGLALQYFNATVADVPANMVCVTGDPAVRCEDFDGVNVQPVVWVGGRYLPTDTLAFTLRLGFPSLNIGASFLF